MDGHDYIYFARRGAEDVKIKHGDTIHSSLKISYSIKNRRTVVNTWSTVYLYTCSTCVHILVLDIHDISLNFGFFLNRPNWPI